MPKRNPKTGRFVKSVGKTTKRKTTRKASSRRKRR